MTNVYVVVSILKKLDPLEVAHPVNKGLAFNLWVNDYFRSERKSIHVVFIGELEKCRLLELSLEDHIEVDYLVFEDVRKGVRVGNNALDQLLIIFQPHVSNDRGKGVSQQLYDLFRRILIITDENMLTFALLSAASNQLLRAAISNPNCVQS